MIRAAPDHNSGEGQMRSFFERWQRIEEAKQAASEDSKELFSEAKSCGFNTKAMRAVFRDKAKLDNEDGSDRANREEFEVICELYRAALDAPRAHPARAHVREAIALAAEKKRAPVDWDEISRREFPDNSPVQVYFIEAPSLGLIKIGSTGMVDRRVDAIQRGLPVPTALIGVISGGTKREVELHKKYAAHRVHGEWFAEVIRPEIELLLAGQAAIEKFDPETGELDEPDSEADAAGDFERDIAQSVPAHLTDGNIVAGGSSRSVVSHSVALPPPSETEQTGAAVPPPPAAPVAIHDDIPEFLRKAS